MTRPQAALNKFLVRPDFALYYRQTKQFSWQNHLTANYAVIFVFAGLLKCQTNENEVELAESQALVVEPNVRIDAQGKSVEFLFLAVSPASVLEHAISMRLSSPQSNVTFSEQPIKDDSKLTDLCRNLVSEVVEEIPGKDIVVNALLEQTIVHLLRKYSLRRLSNELELSRVGLIDRRIRRSVELMHAQLDQDLSLKALAAASYLSPFHFSRLFKKITGSTPHNYLAAMRANRAQLLLADPDMSITEVGARVGYLSASHFTKAFRLATGITPREFRQALVRQ